MLTSWPWHLRMPLCSGADLTCITLNAITIIMARIPEQTSVATRGSEQDESIRHCCMVMSLAWRRFPLAYNGASVYRANRKHFAALGKSSSVHSIMLVVRCAALQLVELDGSSRGAGSEP